MKGSTKIICSVILSTAAFSCRSTAQQLTDSGESLAISLIDNDGNNYSVKKFGDQLWTTTNLRSNIAGSYCYNDSEENCKRFGRLYTWPSALQGCSALGKGWQLPTADEWKKLKILNGHTQDSVEVSKNSYKALILSGPSKFDAMLGGGRNLDGKCTRMNAHGFYWTSTEKDDSNAWFYNFAKEIQALTYTDGEKTRGFSVRCVNDGH